ncbi:MAG: oligosaccharide flippase family protein, partial [Clostridium sp.]|nr:oligosaccharide flippase family protein [Clostridium sp.]
MKLDFLQKKTAVKGMLGGSSGDALLLTAVKLMTMLLSLVTTRLLSQHLTKYDYGTYSQILLLSSTIASVTILGMMDGMNFFFCGVKDNERREAYVATIYLMQLAVSVLAGIAVMALSGPICTYMDNPALGKLMIFSALLPTLQNLIFISQVLLISVGKAKVLALRNLIISVLKLLTIVFVVLFVRDIRIILIVSSLLDVLQLIVFYFILRKNGCIIRLCRADTSLVGPILKYCIPMAVFV